MAKTGGSIDLAGGGFMAGHVGDLPIADAIDVVQSGRLHETYELAALGPRDVQDLLDGLDVTGLSELRQLVQRGRAIIATSAVDAPAGLALRALQRFDQTTGDGNRELLVEAMDALGLELGLDCSGTYDGGGQYSHNGDTCPIHEWLVPEDGEQMLREAGEAP